MSHRIQRGGRGRRVLALGAALLGVALLPGCLHLYWGVKKSLRDPGEKLADFPEKIYEEYDCEQRPLPFLKIERNEITPPRLRAGSEFNHRLVYALCPANPTEVLSGTLETQILFRGRPIVRQSDPRFEIKPGRWIVDTFIQVPPRAEVGIYALRLVFRSAALEFERQITFAVDRANPDAGTRKASR